MILPDVMPGQYEQQQRPAQAPQRVLVQRPTMYSQQARQVQSQQPVGQQYPAQDPLQQALPQSSRHFLDWRMILPIAVIIILILAGFGGFFLWKSRAAERAAGFSSPPSQEVRKVAPPEEVPAPATAAETAEEGGYGTLLTRMSDEEVCRDYVDNPNLAESDRMTADMCTISLSDRVDADFCNNAEFLTGDEARDVCISQVAQEKRDVSLCSGLSQNSGDVFMSCVSSVAVRKNDSSVCWQALGSDDDVERCLSIFMGTYPDIKLCGKFRDESRDSCYSSVGYILVYDGACALIKDSRTRDACYSSVAYELLEPSLCDKVDQVSGDNSRDECFLKLARELNNPSVCDRIIGVGELVSKEGCRALVV